ncbi:MAG: SMP-30/gluconolactonase/LRE family protein [Pseudomonadota bacterium]
MIEVVNATRCRLGEGALWHPTAQRLLWCDIPAGRLHMTSTEDAGAQTMATWVFGECISAAGWVTESDILLATETRLLRLDLLRGTQTLIANLEDEMSHTRSNDGRADPQGGFWIGTMGKKAEPGAGAIYRWHRGALRKLFGGITVPNAICFAPDGRCAYFTDTTTQKVRRVALDGQGWPAAEPEIWLDLSGTPWWPDGAVTDAAGVFWNAQWDGSRIAAYAPDGGFLRAIELPVRRPTCPAFGGPELATLYCTSASIGLDAPPGAGRAPDQTSGAPNGALLALDCGARGRAEPAVLL